jgi:hypothetical protein
MTPLVEFKSLSKKIGNHTVVEGISFKLNKGKITGFKEFSFADVMNNIYNAANKLVFPLDKSI